MKGGGVNNERLDELHRNVRQVADSIGHIVTKNQVRPVLLRSCKPVIWKPFSAEGLISHYPLFNINQQKPFCISFRFISFQFFIGYVYLYCIFIFAESISQALRIVLINMFHCQ